MAFVAVPDVTEIVVDWLHDDQPCINTFHYDTGTITASQIKDLCITVLNYIETNWMADLPTNVELVRVRGVGMWSDSAPEDQTSPGSVVVGTAGGDALPNNVSLAVKRGTGLRGKHNRGRVYWVGISDGMTSDANTIATHVGDLIIANLNGLMVAAAAGTPSAEEVLVDRKTGSHVAVTGYALTDHFLDSSRRRLPGHNIHH